MSLVVEDGTAKANAESYCSVADADTYNAAVGNASWAATVTATKEAALRKATRYIDGTYTFSGFKQTGEQALQWPRIGAERSGWLINEGSVPNQVRDACAELAFQSLTTDLAATGAPGGSVIREKVDVLEVEYTPGGSGLTIFRAAEQLLRDLVLSRSNARIVRG